MKETLRLVPKIFWILFFGYILFVGSLSAKESERVYRSFTLENGLKVILVSDPEINVSSASIDVGVGSLADPTDRQGLAHFLEHMLFLATEKYPKLNEYGEYLKSRGGYSNAFTAPDQTNYHFEVSHEGLWEAMDRFAQFFISPLLSYDYAKREVQAVNSEHQKNILDDGWRLMQLQRSLLKEEHPASCFHTGSIETLGNTTKEELEDFFYSYYGPERMALCVMSKYSLDQLEEKVRSFFSEIKKHPLKNFQVSEDLFNTSNAKKVVKVVPIKDIKQLRISFPVPTQHSDALNKTSSVIGLTMGDEGPGSLLSLLKKKGLATSLSAGVSDETKFYSYCRITVALTSQGLEEYREVLKLCFSYINLLKKSPFPDYVWKEAKNMAFLEELYSPKGEGADKAIEFAHSANSFGLDVAHRLPYIYTKPNLQAYQEVLNALRPDNAQIFLAAKSLMTDKIEKWYQTRFAIGVNEEEFFASLAGMEIHPELRLPSPNPFIPSDIRIFSEQPTLLDSNLHYTLWHYQEREFKRPKLALYLHIITPEASKSLRHIVLTEFYTTLIKEQLNEFSYPALVAGLNYNVFGSEKGIIVNVDGYSQSARKLIGMLAQELPKLNVSENTFQMVKERYIQHIQNAPFAPAYEVAREFSRKVSLKQYFMPEEKLSVAEGLELRDVVEFNRTLYQKKHVEGLFCGNVTGTQAKEMIKNFSQALGAHGYPAHRAFQNKELHLTQSEDLVYKNILPTNNSCLRMDYQVGLRNRETEAATWILDRAIKNAFFTEMRTKQMLGYIVFSGSYAREHLQSLVFIIQSGTYPAEELLGRANAFTLNIPEIISQLPEEQFEAIVRSLIEERKQKPKSIVEKATTFYHLILKEKSNFALLEEEISALNKVSREDVLQLSKDVFSEKTRKRISYLLNASQHPEGELTPSIKDINTFKEGQTFAP